MGYPANVYEKQVRYVYDKKSVTEMADAAGKSGSFYTREDATNTIRILLTKHVDKLAEWLKSRQRTLRLTFEANEPIGFVVERGGKRTETNKFLIYLVKDLGDKTKCGFYVASILPVI